MKTIAECKSGEIIKWNGYEWIVIDDGIQSAHRIYGANADRIYGEKILLMKDILKMMPFDDREIGCSNNWKESTAREYLNGEFYESLSNRDALFDFESDLTADNGDKDYGSSIDKVFLISCDFYRRHRKEITPASDWWWTITPDASHLYLVRYVSSDSSLYSGPAYYGSIGLRPACCVLSSLQVNEDDKKENIMKCENCDECVYVGEGDSLCMKTQNIVITDFGCPTEEYQGCKKMSSTFKPQKCNSN